MSSLHLTRSSSVRDPRRRPIRLLIASTTCLLATPRVRADSPPPASLIERACRRAGLHERGSDAAVATAPWLPRLRIGAALHREQRPMLDALAVQAYARLEWPLERTIGRGELDRLRGARQRAAERESLVDRIAEA